MIATADEAEQADGAENEQADGASVLLKSSEGAVRRAEAS